jgi:hypothetical protein
LANIPLHTNKKYNIKTNVKQKPRKNPLVAFSKCEFSVEINNIWTIISEGGREYLSSDISLGENIS